MAPRIEMKKICPRNIAERPSTRTCNAPPGTAQRSDMPWGDGATNASTAALTPAIPATAIREQAIRPPARPFRDENRPGKPLSAASAHAQTARASLIAPPILELTPRSAPPPWPQERKKGTREDRLVRP